MFTNNKPQQSLKDCVPAYSVKQILPTTSHLAPSFGETPFKIMKKLYGSWN